MQISMGTFIAIACQGEVGAGIENTAAPSVTGTMTVGETVTVSLGTWTGADSLAGSLRYVSDDTEIDTFTEDGTYLLADADFGQQLYLHVTAEPGAVTAESAATAAVNVVVYVNTTTGASGNNGRSAGAAKDTIANAITLLTTSWSSRGIIRITAPTSARNPNVLPPAGDFEFRPTDDVTPWYTESASRFTSGWTSLGSGVYSRTTNFQGFDPYIESLLDGDGLFTRLNRKLVGDQTTPAEGEWGWVTGSPGTWYVHLPGAADPNTHTIAFVQFARGWQFNAAGNYVIRGAHFRYSETNGLIYTTHNDANVEAYDCVFEYGGCGIESTVASVIYAEDCEAIRCRNDGFNARGTSQLTLINCESHDNHDEGVSPHDSAVLTISGGRYYNNAHSGLAAINSTVLDIDGATFDLNGQNPGASGIELGHGVAIANTVTGSITNCVMENNVNSGIYNISSPNVITLTGNTSGTGAGNGDADVGA